MTINIATVSERVGLQGGHSSFRRMVNNPQVGDIIRRATPCGVAYGHSRLMTSNPNNQPPPFITSANNEERLTHKRRLYMKGISSGQSLRPLYKQSCT